LSYETLKVEREGALCWLTLDRADSLNASLDAGSLEAVVAMEDRNQILCTPTEDFREGMLAFLQKREPIYSDR